MEHKYGRNLRKTSKIGQNSMKKRQFFAIILPWMANYGSERSFLLIFGARDDLGKVSWESDAQKCQNQLTPPYFDQLSEWSQPLCIVLCLFKLLKTRLENSDNKFNLDLIIFLFWNFGILKFAINWKCAEPSLSQQASLFLSL